MSRGVKSLTNYVILFFKSPYFKNNMPLKPQKTKSNVK